MYSNNILGALQCNGKTTGLEPKQPGFDSSLFISWITLAK